MEIVEHNVDESINVGISGIRIECLKFADDLETLARNTASAYKQIEILKEKRM